MEKTNIAITIDVIAKLKKIYEGKTFSDRLVLITELFQNSQRARAKKVDIDIGNGSMSFKDDGLGSKTPGDILKLDYSNWESTDEGFGIGLWSWLAIEGIQGIKIRSNKWAISLTVDKIFNENNLNAAVELGLEKIKGFEVTIYSHKFHRENEVLLKRIVSDAETQNFDVFINGNKIDKKDLYEEAKKHPFCKTYSNRLFTATLYPERYGGVDVYYERRLIDNFYPSEYIGGVCEVNKKTLTLQEPDRKNVIRDNNRTVFMQKLEECRKDLYLDIVKSGDPRDIEEYSYQIDAVLDVEDYEGYLLADDLILEVKTDIRNVEDINPANKQRAFNRLLDEISGRNLQLSLTDNIGTGEDEQLIEKLLNTSSTYKWIKNRDAIDNPVYPIEEFDNVDEIAENVVLLSIGDAIYRKVNIEEHLDSFSEENEEVTSSKTVKTVKSKKKKDSLRNILKKTIRKVWVKSNEVEDYQDLIAKVEYYGVKVFISKNILHERVFRNNNVPYITDIESGIKKTNFKWGVELRTKKEEKFIKLLMPICSYYGLPYNTFKIGYLKLMVETVLDNRVIHREVIENKKGQIVLFGLTDGNTIILDRRALGLNRFNLNGPGTGLGVNEYKALMANLKTVAHELAHLIYKTEDNTKEHAQMEDLIYDEIVGVYLSL